MPWAHESQTMLYGADDLCEQYRAKRLADRRTRLQKYKDTLTALQNEMAAEINQEWPGPSFMHDSDRGYALAALEDMTDGGLMAIHCLEQARD